MPAAANGWAAGIGEDRIARIHDPVGLLPSMREASMLALSILAEIVAVWQERQAAPLGSTALIPLAAGRSSRFEGGDKLMASYRGRRVIDHAAGLLRGETVAARIAIVAPDQPDRAEALRAAGWAVTVCHETDSGQAASLATGIREVAQCGRADAAMVLLADMPEVHLFTLREALTLQRSAVMSQAKTALLPPDAHAFHLRR
jgi:xanthine dehydrogenase accessory factor